MSKSRRLIFHKKEPGKINLGDQPRLVENLFECRAGDLVIITGPGVRCEAFITRLELDKTKQTITAVLGCGPVTVNAGQKGKSLTVAQRVKISPVCSENGILGRTNSEIEKSTKKRKPKRRKK